MMTRVLLLASACAFLGGCASTLTTTDVAAPATTAGFRYGTNEQPIDPNMTEYMPWQLGPSSPKTKAAHDEPIVTATVAQWGTVKARSDVLATFPQPLTVAPGRNRTVQPCQQQALEAALKYNPNTQVEAVSVGPERRLPNGTYRGPVRMRVVYSRPDFYEVREAVMTCTTTPNGRFVRAQVISPT
jgi:hypothetical protein